MRKKEAKKSKKIGLSDLLDMPLDVVADVSRTIITDRTELWVENYKSIERYAPEEISLVQKDYRMSITGRGLEIISMTDEEILIRGTILQVSYLS